MPALLSGEDAAPMLDPTFGPRKWVCRQLGSCGIAGSILGATVSQVLPGIGSWHVWPEGRVLTRSEVALLSLGAILGEHGTEPDVNFELLAKKLGVSGLLVGSGRDVRNVEIVRLSLGEKSVMLLAAAAGEVLDRLNSHGFFKIDGPLLDESLVNLTRMLLGHDPIRIHLRGHLDKMEAAFSAKGH